MRDNWLLFVGAVAFILNGAVYLSGYDYGQNWSPTGRAWAGGISVGLGVAFILLGLLTWAWRPSENDGQEAGHG